jgi:hypothetical protein
MAACKNLLVRALRRQEGSPLQGAAAGVFSRRRMLATVHPL